MKLLLVEDHRDIAGVIIDYFEIKGHVIDYAVNGKHGLELGSDNHFDVIILDIMLPKMNGLDICQSLRQIGNDTPILMLTARDDKDDIINGFNCGADDYLVKPFDLSILEARVHALNRRKTGELVTRSLAFHDLMLDLKSQIAFREGIQITLNQTQFKMLKMLMMNAPNIVNRESISYELWPDELPDSDLLRSHIYQLRCLIDKPFKTQYLRTVPKRGYRLVSE